MQFSAISSSCSFPSLCPYITSPFSSTSSRPAIVPISTNHHQRRSKRQRALAGPLICYTCKLPLVTRNTAHRTEGKTGTCVTLLFQCCTCTVWLIQSLGWNIRASAPGWRKTLIFETSWRVLGPAQPHIHWAPNLILFGIKRPELEAKHSPPCNAEVRMNRCTPLLPLCCLCDVHRDKCNL